MVRAAGHAKVTHNVPRTTRDAPRSSAGKNGETAKRADDLHHRVNLRCKPFPTRRRGIPVAKPWTDSAGWTAAPWEAPTPTSIHCGTSTLAARGVVTPLAAAGVWPPLRHRRRLVPHPNGFRQGCPSRVRSGSRISPTPDAHPPPGTRDVGVTKTGASLHETPEPWVRTPQRGPRGVPARRCCVARPAESGG